MTEAVALPSLWIVSLPRSLSSQAWQWARAALGLAAPGWTTDGEILNLDRYAIGEGSGARHFLRPDDGAAFGGAVDLLDQLVQPVGHAYKDVTQPEVLAAWFGWAPRGCRVLRLRRPIADVAFSMLARGWTYPARWADGVDHPEDALIDGLIRARALLDRIPAHTLSFDDLINDDEALPVSVAALYPELTLPELPFFDRAFLERRAQVLASRQTDRHRALSDRVLRRLERAEEGPEEGGSRPIVRAAAARADRPRLLVVGDAVAPTGFSRVTASVLAGLVDRYDVHQLGLKYLGGPHALPWTVHPCSDARGIGDLTELCHRLRPDVVWLVNDIWVLGDYVRALTAIDHGARRPRLVAYCPIDSEPMSPVFLRGLEGLDRLVAYNGFGRDAIAAAAARLEERPSWSEVDVIPHGVETADFYPMHALDGDLVASRRRSRAALFGSHALDDAFIVLNANRNQPRKRIDITVKGFAEFARDRPDARLYLHMGTEDVGWDLRGLAERFGITDRMIISMDQRLQPRLTLEQLNHVYNACDVGVNTSSSEGWGLVAFEHAATGAAQIVPRHTAPAELWEGAAEQLDIALSLCQPRVLTDEHLPSVDSLTAALARLYDDRALLEARSRAAYARATDAELHWSHIAGAWARVFDAELAQAGGPR